jgi:uncharacterized repeat protein (TIGR01451 family)
MKRLLAMAALAGLGIWQQGALAAGTPANTTIANKATINYSVGGTAQTPIESAPGLGNTTPGVGAGVNTTFLVDDKIDLTVTELSTGNTVVNPGQTNQVTGFRVTNTGNAPHAFALAAVNNAAGSVFGNADSTDVNNLRVIVDSNANGTYEAADLTANINNINTLAADANIVVFIVADVPVTTANGQFANVRLTASAAVNNTPASLVTETAGPDTASVDFVFADGAAGGNTARDGRGFADDQYAVQSARLTVTKASVVISDPFNLLVNPKAIPGAVVEYRVTVANTGTQDATGVTLLDPMPLNTAFRPNSYSGNTQDVRITINAVDTFCIAEAGGVDSNTDGCVLTAGNALQVGGSALPTLPSAGPTNTADIRFQVTINN